MNEISVTPATESAFVRPVDIPRTCTDEALLEACAMWMAGVGGDVVAAKLGISVEMAGGWTQKRGWRECCARLRDEVRLGAHGGVTRCISLALKEIEDRLVLGEKTGYYTTNAVGQREYHEAREPLPAWQVSNIMNKLIDKQLKLEDRLVGKSGMDPDMMPVKELAAALASIARRKPGNVQTIDADVQ